jgi:hypothetical protein
MFQAPSSNEEIPITELCPKCLFCHDEFRKVFCDFM